MIFVAIAFSSRVLQAEGWPHVRGENYDGLSTETGLANEWPSQGPPVLWVKELGQGYSSIVVRDNRAFTQYQTLAGQFLLCMDAETGKTIWSYRYDWPFEMTGLYPGPYSTPTLSGDHVYFTTPAGSAGCLTMDGNLVWSRELKKGFDGQGTDFGYACSPTVLDGKVILPIGGRGASIVALSATTGDIVWKSGDEPASYTPVLPITVNGQHQVIGYLQHDIVGCDLATGKQLWKHTLSRGYDEHSAWPLYREPLLWTSAPFQAGSRLWKLESTETPTCQEVWHSELMSNDVSSSVLVDGTIYGFDLTEAQSKAHRPSRGEFRAIDFLTGKQLWANGDAEHRRSTDFDENRDSKVVGHASLLAADGKLFLLNDLGDLILAEANQKQYVELARTRVLGGEIGWASPALDNGRLYVRNRSRVVCLYVGTSRASNVATTLTVADLPQGSVQDYTRFLGVEPEYAMDAPTRKWLWNWYLAGAAILLIAGLLVLAVRTSFPKRCSVDVARALFVAITLTTGVFVGPISSLLINDFVFTWPVSVFIAFVAAVYHSEVRRSGPRPALSQRRLSRMVGFVFILVCAAYFFACRRLSLATQWTFLCGFPAAVPVVLLDRYLQNKLNRISNQSTKATLASLVVGWGLTQVAFAMYFAMALLVLSQKYELMDR